MASEFKLPDLGEGVESATVGTILAKVGDAVAPGAMLMELESEKATLPVSATFSGTVAALSVKVGDTVKSGSVVLTYDGGNGAAPAAAKPAEKAAPVVAKQPESAPAPKAPIAAPPAPVRSGPVAAAPATRRLARELGVDLQSVNGSGSGGRVTKDDVKGHFVRQAGGGAGRVAAPPLPDFAQWGAVERRPMNAIAKASARNLSVAWQVAPQVTQHELADVTDLENARRDFVKANAKSPKVTMTVLAMKAVVAAMRDYPHFNASYDADTQEIVVKKYYHFGVAVDTEHGLMVPVIRDVDKKSLVELATELTEVAEKARNKRLDPAQMKGGCFTITNLGGIGGTAFSPIVNYPEVAILGLARSRMEYVLRDGSPQFRLMLPLCLTYDHRVINGADGARFVARLANLLADPFTMLAQL